MFPLFVDPTTNQELGTALVSAQEQVGGQLVSGSAPSAVPDGSKNVLEDLLWCRSTCMLCEGHKFRTLQEHRCLPSFTVALRMCW